MSKIMILGACLPTMGMAFAAPEGSGSSVGVKQYKTLQGAINSLDVTNDDHWTGNGDPAMAFIHDLTGDESLKRVDVRAATPEGFNRSNAAAAPTLKGEENDATGSITSTLASTIQAITNADLGDDNGSQNDEADQGVRMIPDAVSPQVEAILKMMSSAINADHVDPVILLEAVSAAASDNRYSRNSALQNVVRGYQVSQAQIKDVQGRLDARIADRAQKNAASRLATAEREGE